MSAPIDIPNEDNSPTPPTDFRFGGRSRSYTISYPSAQGEHPRPPDAPLPSRSPTSGFLATALGGLIGRSVAPPSPSSVASSVDSIGPETPPSGVTSNPSINVEDHHVEEEKDTVGFYGFKRNLPLGRGGGVMGARRSSWAPLDPPAGGVLALLSKQSQSSKDSSDDSGLGGLQPAFGLFRRLSLGNPIGYRPAVSAPIGPSAASGWPQPGPTSTNESDSAIVDEPDDGQRHGRPFGRRGSTTKRKLSPMSEQMLRGHWTGGHF